MSLSPVVLLLERPLQADRIGPQARDPGTRLANQNESKDTTYTMGNSWLAEHHRVGNQGWGNGIAHLFNDKRWGRAQEGTQGNAYNSLFTVLSGDPVHDAVYRSLRRGVMRTKNPASGCVNYESTVSRAGAHGDDSPVAMLEQNTILPYPCSSMCGTQSWVNYTR
jgi:hypothetical protein